jgi:hypothetical protein
MFKLSLPEIMFYYNLLQREVCYYEGEESFFVDAVATADLLPAGIDGHGQAVAL